MIPQTARRSALPILVLCAQLTPLPAHALTLPAWKTTRSDLPEFDTSYFVQNAPQRSHPHRSSRGRSAGQDIADRSFFRSWAYGSEPLGLFLEHIYQPVRYRFASVNGLSRPVDQTNDRHKAHHIPEVLKFLIEQTRVPPLEPARPTTASTADNSAGAPTDTVTFGGPITALQSAPATVPLPGSAWLLVSALALSLFFARRRA